ncbi:ArdC family protein [Sphingomonas sp. 10B4]|uniref:ArdC family protein n=1 Tax=Sphingomonas sp. 10B4 TaxID=3048575 RepID=UPI002AB47DE6|nr:zincin-like metallopeptidase domain-containing protein [Sphingomonas sp. 10B4]MDY7524267.1 zincin-like metallopeptidase domain-containing protein [Sphingomonas sp. 10B4]MEB0282267.1 zincin-like metallopeptidase domain-containing protein [Sphingomonas sp. 10B4]
MQRATSKPSPAEIITQTIIEKLAGGVRPWARPWHPGTETGRPLRANGQPYRGINTFWLWLAADACGYRSRYWMTYKQAQALGGQVREGERAQIAIFYKTYTKKGAAAASGDPADELRRVMRSYAVFSTDQIDGLPEQYHPPVVELVPPHDILAPRAQMFIERLPARLHHGGDRAFYDRLSDSITLPHIAQFSSRAQWAATLAHEAGHWTGHPDRLARTFGKRFGDDAYAFEELVAELASALLGADLGLPVDHLDNHAAYIGSWLTILKRDARALMTAAARAEDAAGYLMRASGLDTAVQDGAGSLREAA